MFERKTQARKRHTQKKQSGFTLIEVLAAVVIFSIVYAGFIKIQHNNIESVRAEVAGVQLKKIANAANRYITDNYSTLMGIATSTQPALIRISDLQAANILDPGVSSTNAYGQALCALVMQPTPGQLTGLVVTEGGEAVNDIDLAGMVSAVGAAGGGIYTDTPTALVGARGGWAVNTAPYSNANQLGQNCTGAAGTVSLTTGHAAVALWFENNDLTAGFLYRESIPGRPELNRMATTLDMDSNDITNAGDIGATNVTTSANVTASGAVTAAGKVNANAGIDVNGTNILTSSRNLVNLGSISASGAITTSSVVQGSTLRPTAVVTKDTGCSPNGSIAQDSTGKLLSCQSG
ncbi:MAG: shufflon system plasmid conjugative transfer pilus tip adhesin PilV, partial [Hydrogenovibrio sp.]